MRTAPAIQGRKIRSLVFSTDLAVICHCDADAVLAVYPFTCQPAITQALVAASQRPVFNGVGGSITQGERCVGGPALRDVRRGRRGGEPRPFRGSISALVKGSRARVRDGLRRR